MSALGVADEDVGFEETVPVRTRLRAYGTRLRPAWRATAAFVLYQAIAVAIWVAPMLPDFGREHLGNGLQDSRYYQWALAWTPWALSHGIDPLHASVVFAPSGTSLAWSAFVPGPALVAWPITAVFGSIVSLNTLLAVAPALAAWAAYLVCIRLTHRFWPSFAGGFLFGFGAYLSANMGGWLNLVLVFPIPLLVYLVIRRVEGSLGPVAFVAGLVASLVALFSISTEVFATTMLFGAIAFVGALAFGREIRRSLLRTGALVLLAGGIAMIVLSPYLHAVVADPSARPVRRTDLASPDVTSFVVPPPTILAGGSAVDATTQERLGWRPGSGQCYLGVAAVGMLIAFGVTERRRRATWALLGLVVVCITLSLGPILHVAGRTYDPLPERAVAALPFMGSALPARFAVYTWLAVAMIAALWLAWGSGRASWLRWSIVAVVVVSLVPNAPNRAGPIQVPSFFASDQLDRVIAQGENVFVIPHDKGEEMLWQAISDFRFDMPQGYIGKLPSALDDGPLARGLHVGGDHHPVTATAFADWTRAHAVTAVILDDRARDRFASLVEGADLIQVYRSGGISVWRWPVAQPDPPGKMS